MTYEEAIKQLKDEIHEAIPKSAITARKHNEAVGMAIEALEKQIPKKPYDVDEDVRTFDCPSCLSHLFACDAFEDVEYCCVCGQALDWSDT